MQEKEIKDIHIGKEEVKFSLFENELSYILKTLKIPQEPITTNKFNEVAACKVNVQKSLAFLYISNAQYEKD